MTFREAMLSLQLLAETEVGAVQRLAVNRLNAQQDAAAAALKQSLG